MVIKEFQQFIITIDPSFQSLPASPYHVIYFISHLFNKGLAASTILSKMSAISYIHKLRFQRDIMSHFLIEKCLAGVKRLAPSSDQRLPITLPILEKMGAHCLHVTKNPYNRKLLHAMLMLGFHGFLRPGEMTMSKNNILFENVELCPLNVSITFSSYKHHYGSPITIIVPAQGGPTCPIPSLQAYLTARGSSPGPLFVYADGHPVPYIQFKQWFSDLLIICCIKGHFNPHSLRIGAATLSIAKGYASSLVQQMGRWRSSAYLRYVRLPSIKLT